MVMITTFVVDLAFDADGGSDRDVDQHLDDYEQDIAHGDKGLLQKRPSTTRNQMTTAATRMTNVVIKTKTIVLHVLLQNDPSIMASLYSYQVARAIVINRDFLYPLQMATKKIHGYIPEVK